LYHRRKARACAEVPRRQWPLVADATVITKHNSKRLRNLPDLSWVYSIAILRRRFVMTQAAGTAAQASDTTTSVHPLIESNRVEGTPVYSPQGKHVGSIHYLIIEKVSGRVVYAVMSFGGFLGFGSHEHTIPWEKLNYDTQLGGYRTDITQEELSGAPVISGDERIWWDRRREQDLHDHWKVPTYWGW
jgi:PRC-barrel domain